MRSLLLLLLCAGTLYPQGQILIVKKKAAGSSPPAIVCQGHGFSSVAVLALNANTTSGSASSGGGTTCDIQAHDLIWVNVSIHGGTGCYGGSPPTVTISDTGSTNTFTQLGAKVSNSAYGVPCFWHFWVDATAKTGNTITANFSGTTSLSNETINFLVFRSSPAASSWAASTRDEKNFGQSAGTVTSNSLGTGASNDVLVADAGVRLTGYTLSAGACSNSLNCTLAATTQSQYSAAEYQVMTGSEAVTVSMGINPTTNNGPVMVSARFTPTLP